MAFINRYVRGTTVEAVQYNGKNAHLFKLWTKGEILECDTPEPSECNPSGVYLKVGKNQPPAEPGDWVVKENGQYKVLTNEYFQQTFTIIP